MQPFSTAHLTFNCSAGISESMMMQLQVQVRDEFPLIYDAEREREDYDTNLHLDQRMIREQLTLN